MSEEGYSKLVDSVGLMSRKQLDRCLKEGKADHLRDVAREEIVARSAHSNSKANLSIVIAVISAIVAILAWLFPRVP